jgi:transcriptional regulator with XRE-family HTH domain
MANQHTPIAVDGKRMRALREARGVSADALGWHAGLNSRHIWHLDSGKYQRAAAMVMAAIAQVLNTTIEYLLGLTNDPRSIAELIAAAGPAAEEQVAEAGPAEPSEVGDQGGNGSIVSSSKATRSTL